MSLDVGSVGKRRRKEDVDRLAAVLSRSYIYDVYFVLRPSIGICKPREPLNNYLPKYLSSKHCGANSTDFDQYLTFIHLQVSLHLFCCDRFKHVTFSQIGIVLP